jgi:hypothetical protein
MTKLERLDGLLRRDPQRAKVAQTEQLSGPGLQPGDPILPKPFSPDALTRKVREVLDRPAPFSRPRPRADQWWP